MSDTTRSYWLNTMLKISDPVIINAAEQKLSQTLPIEFHPGRKQYMLLEALGRTLVGISPWLELEDVPEEEKSIHAEYRVLCRKAIENAVDPQSKDYMNFSEGYGQALVDAAFLAQAILRAPNELYYKLSQEGKTNLIKALKTTRKFVPFMCNWLFFSATIEAFLYKIGEEYDPVRIEYAIRMHMKWYVGDGFYGDGEFFHMDYYNSFVIQPMFYDVLKTVVNTRDDYPELFKTVTARAARHSAILEMLINKDGTYPVVGRSTTYRFAVFHALSQAVLEDFLPETLPANQVRCGLTEVIKQVLSGRGMFDENGFLTPGVYGRQEKMAEDYICVGSLYFCLTVFLPLGLPASNKFWSGEECSWTAKKIWSGEDVSRDHSID